MAITVHMRWPQLNSQITSVQRHLSVGGRGIATRCVRAGNVDVASEIPTRLVKLYHEVQHPALSNRTYSRAVMEFTEVAVLAYECGYSEEGLLPELKACAEGLDVEPSSKLDLEGNCLLCTSIVWVTLMLSPKTVQRWSAGKAVSEETFQLWFGFVSMIVDAYFNKRMAWYPIERLQLELSAHMGRLEHHEIVAEWARIVYTTLNRIYPQFPSD